MGWADAWFETHPDHQTPTQKQSGGLTAHTSGGGPCLCRPVGQASGPKLWTPGVVVGAWFFPNPGRWWPGPLPGLLGAVGHRPWLGAHPSAVGGGLQAAS